MSWRKKGRKKEREGGERGQSEGRMEERGVCEKMSLHHNGSEPFPSQARQTLNEMQVKILVSN